MFHVSSIMRFTESSSWILIMFYVIWVGKLATKKSVLLLLISYIHWFHWSEMLVKKDIAISFHNLMFLLKLPSDL